MLLLFCTINRSFRLTIVYSFTFSFFCCIVEFDSFIQLSLVCYKQVYGQVQEFAIVIIKVCYLGEKLTFIMCNKQSFTLLCYYLMLALTMILLKMDCFNKFYSSYRDDGVQ